MGWLDDLGLTLGESAGGYGYSGGTGQAVSGASSTVWNPYVSNPQGQVAGTSTPNYSTQNASLMPTPQDPRAPTYRAPSPTPPAPTPQPGQPTGPSSQDQYFSYLDQVAGNLPGTQSNLEQQVNNLFSGSQGTINTAMSGSLAELGTQKEKVASNAATSLRDLSQSMRNQLKAGQSYLGGIPGASTSTGANQYNAALTKQGNQNRANLAKQSNELSANIDLQVNKVKQTAQDQLSQLETWKNNELLKVANFIQQQRGQIDQQKASYIQQQLYNLDNQVNTFKQGLYTWAMNNSTTLDQLKQKLAAFSGGNPTDIMQPGWEQLQVGMPTSESGVDYTGVQNLAKKLPKNPLGGYGSNFFTNFGQP